MGFLKPFFKNTYRDGESKQGRSSFENLSEDQLESHLKIARYGDFMLTDAVYQDKESGIKIPVIMASASREILLDIFLDLLEPLGHEVDVVLETSHDRRGSHQDLYREDIDLPILKSSIFEFEEMLLGDGCTGIAVLNPDIPQEIQLDEHKLLIVYGQELADFEDILDDYGLPLMEKMRFITEAEHIHSSTEEFARQFEEMRFRLGIDDE